LQEKIELTGLQEKVELTGARMRPKEIISVFLLCVVVPVTGVLSVGLSGDGGNAFADDSAEGEVRGRRRRQRRKLQNSLSPLSVRATRRVRIWTRPAEDSLGEVTRNTYLPYVGRVKGTKKLCPGGVWYQVGSQRHLCADYGQPSYRFPHGRVQPALREGKLIPFPVYFAKRDGVPVYKNAEDAAQGSLDRVVEKGFSFAARRIRRIGGESFLTTWSLERVPRKELYKHRPPEFEGVRLSGRPENPWACVYKRPGIWAFDRPGGGRRKKVKRIRYQTWVRILEEKKTRGRLFYRVGPQKWIRARGVRRIRFSDPPKGLESENEPWVEVLTGEQTLVMYEGRKPIYAAIVSTGKHSDPTPYGVFRVWIKIACEAMNNRPGAAKQYKVEAVPWILYFHESYGIHGTYWHNGFGRPRSNGCINLSPKDAKFVFERSLPPLPHGWRSRWAEKSSPGMIVRVRKHVKHEVGVVPVTVRER